MASLKQVSYSVHISTSDNIKLAIIKKFTSLDYTRSINAPGSLQVILPATDENRALVSTGSETRRDMRLEVWRLLGTREYLETSAQWIVRKVVIDDDQQTIELTADSGLILLNRRIIAYDSGTSQSSKSGATDDVIVEFVNENAGSAATDTNRDWSSLIDIRSSNSLGPAVSKSSSRRKLLTTVQEVARQSIVTGSPIFFDMNYLPGSGKFEFRTYARQRGLDLTTGQNQLIFSGEYANLTNEIREDDFSDESTFVYAAGQGQGTDRVVVTACDVGRIDKSPFGRIETLVDGRNTSASADLVSDANDRLRQGRPKRVLSGTIINKPGAEYGLDWNWGDKVKAEIDGEVFTARIDTVSISVSRGQEEIKPSIRIED